MESYFSADFFTNNRRKLRESIAGDAPIVVTANGIMQRSGDEPFKFHQDSSFWYLTGISASGLVLVMYGNETYLIVPTLTFEREAFDGALDLDAFTATSGITQFLDARSGWKKLQQATQKSHAVATLLSPPSYMKRHGLYTLPFRRQLLAKLKRTDPGLKIQDVREELAHLRCIKQPPEIRAIQQTIDITVQTLADIRKPELLSSIRYEYELEAAIQYGFRKRGANGEAFGSVVGAGKHSTTLHHTDNDGLVTKGDLIVVDIGADFEHYAADVARTISSEPLNARKTAVFNAVAEAQDYALSLIKPGILPLDYEKSVETFVGVKLLELGVITEASRENIRHYFPHATSHFLGLDTHDVGDYRKPYEAGMVIACEPGIYIPEEGIGVRIEDDVLITETGNTVLSSACPRQAF